MANVAEKVRALIDDTVKAQGVSLWDVRYVKEGAENFLRVFIDSPGGIGIDDCERVSRAIDPLLDEADPIENSYCLEVCSPGLERELVRPEHFRSMIGRPVTVKLYRAKDGQKVFAGTLVDGPDPIVVQIGEQAVSFQKSEASSVRLDDFEQ